MLIKKYKFSIKIFSGECEYKGLSNNIILYCYMNSLNTTILTRGEKFYKLT